MHHISFPITTEFPKRNKNVDVDVYEEMDIN